jgi:hypothetical protein
VEGRAAYFDKGCTGYLHQRCWCDCSRDGSCDSVAWGDGFVCAFWDSRSASTPCSQRTSWAHCGGARRR